MGEDAQVDHLETPTPTNRKPRKTTSTPADMSPVDLTLDAARRSRRSRSPTTAADGVQPPVKGKSSPAHQARHVTPGKSGLAPDKCPTSGDSGRDDVMQVAFMHSELTCIREHMEKLTSLPKDISTLRNSVESSQGDVNVVGTHCVAMKADVASMAGDMHNSANEVNSIKTHVIGLRSHTMALKGDLHGLAKNVVESKIISKGTKDEVASARVDIVRVGDDVNIVKTDVMGVDSKVSVICQDLSSLKHDVNVIKADVVSIKHDIAAFKSELANISSGVQAIQWSLGREGSPEYRDAGMCTDNEQVEIKSDPGTPEQDPAVVTHVQEEGNGNDASLNTSEVTFRPREEEVTYEEVMRVDKGLDSEIDAIEDTQKNKGDILLSLPPAPTQERPISVTQFGDSQDDTEESQSILQVRQRDHELLMPVPTIGEIIERDVQDAGPSGSGLPYTVISEARVDRDGKTFFVLETQQETHQEEPTQETENSTHAQKLPPPPPTPRKLKKGRRKEKR